MSLVIKDRLICADIHCNQKLGYFDIKNNSRFCRRCRLLHTVLMWKCEKCPNIITSADCRETRKVCKQCSGMAPKYEFTPIEKK